MPPNPSTTLSPRVPGASGLVSVQDDILHGLNDVIGALTGRTTTPITILGQFKYSFGTPGASKVLTSDANGNATWETGIAGAATSLSNTADATINADSDASGGGIIAFQIAGAQKASIEQNGYLKLGAGLDLNGQAIISSGLTTGQVLRATSATATGWGALSLSTAAAITGTLPVGNGGTGATTFTANYLLKGNTASALSSSVAYDDGTNIGIGTAVPEDLLHVQKAGALSQIILGKNQVSGYSAIQLRGAAATYNWIIGQQYNLGSGLEFTPSTLVEGTVFTTPALVIVSPTNYVGIGLNNPATLLHTKGVGVAVSGTNANATIEDSTVFVATPGEGGTLILRGVYQTVGAGGAAASFGAIKGYKENATDDNYASALGLYTRANGGNLTKQVTIASDGNVTLTGSLGLTGTRVSKGWFTDLEVTNAIVGSITGNAATVTGLTVTAGKTLTAQNTLTLSATDGSTLAIGTGGTLGTAAYTAATAYEAAGGIATHAALTTGVHGLDAKAPLASPTFTGTVTIPTPFTLGAVSVTATGAELNFLVGVTSAIQTQLDSKVSATLPWSISQSTTGRGTVTTDGIAVTVTGTNTFFLVDLNPGETITINGVTRTIAAITSNTSMTTTVAFGANTNQAYTIPGGVKFTFQGNTAFGIGTTTPATIPGYAAIQTGPSVQMYAANGAARWIVATAGATNAEHPQFIWRHGGCTDGDRNYRLTVNMHTVGTSDGISNLTLDQPVDDFSSNQHLMTWTKDGNIGIGTATPVVTLDVYKSLTGYLGTAYNTPSLYLQTGTASGYSGIGFKDSQSHREAFFGVVETSDTTGDFVFQGYTGDGATYKEYMRITALGYVGIGIVTPGQTLDVYAATGASLRLAGNATSNPFLEFCQVTTQRAYIQYNNSGYVQYDAPIHYFSTGNLGINRAAPACYLDVNGTVRAGPLTAPSAITYTGGSNAVTLTDTKFASIQGTSGVPVTGQLYRTPMLYLERWSDSNITGTGTISTSGTAVTGNGTLFTTELTVGATIYAGGQSKVVSVITNDTSLTVSVAFSPDLGAGTSFLKPHSDDSNPQMETLILIEAQATTNCTNSLGGISSIVTSSTPKPTNGQPICSIVAKANATASSGTQRETFAANFIAYCSGAATAPQNLVGIEVDIVNGKADVSSIGNPNFTAFWAQAAGGYESNNAVYISTTGTGSKWRYGVFTNVEFSANVAYLGNTSTTGAGLFVSTAGTGLALEAYCGGTATNLLKVTKGGTGDVQAILGTTEATGGNVYLDFWARNADIATYSARIIRESGANGVLRFLNRGTGGIYFNTPTAELARIDGSGSVGIGVAPKVWSSYSPIQVGSQAAFFGLTAAAAGAGTLVGNNVYWDDVDERWEYITAGANDEASLYEQSNGAHIFYVTSTAGAANAAISWTEAMRITNGANVGIGTTSPNLLGVNTALTLSSVSADTQAYIEIQGFKTGDAAYGGICFFNSTADAAAINARRDGANDAGALAFSTQPAGGALTERMRISSAGNVGIGTTAPGAPLEVKGPGATTLADFTKPLIRIQPNVGASDAIFLFGAASASINRAAIYSTGSEAGGDTNGDLRFAVGLAGTPINAALVITSTGNVVIGTAAIATNATDGFLYIPTMAGAPSGTPTTHTGRAAMVLDTSNNRLYLYDPVGAGWLYAALT